MIDSFVWTDLSTFDLGMARADYAEIFGWTFRRDGAYEFALSDGHEVAAIFPMPARLAEIGMPSFWMSYIRVQDIDQSIAQARGHDRVIIEVEPEPFGTDARVALVRDPSGAGFTLYEGPDIPEKPDRLGRVTRRFHHLPDVALIEAFYGDLFGWSFSKRAATPWPVYDIHHADGTLIAQAEEVPKEIRGKFRYWMPCFAARSVEEAVATIRARGGQSLVDLPQGRRMLADRQGAHFMVEPADGSGAG